MRIVYRQKSSEKGRNFKFNICQSLEPLCVFSFETYKTTVTANFVTLHTIIAIEPKADKQHDLAKVEKRHKHKK